MEAGIRKILIVASFSLLLCIACRKERPFVASNAYQSAEAEFRRGDLQLALAETDNALRLMGGTGNDAVWRFRLLKAEILIWQGLSQDALILLKDTTLHGPTLDELSARRNSLMGVAESNLQQLDLAQRTFAETEKMPGAQSPQIMGDLLLGEGKLAALHHDPQESELLFNRALQIAQQHGQTFLAGKALGNLGVRTTRQESGHGG